MPKQILVINPNSTDAVTRAIDRALEPLRLPGGPLVNCLTLREGPAGIESQGDVERVVLPLCHEVADRQADTAAFVIACFSDPGLHAVREITRKPVLGIAECGIVTALTLGDRFGIIAILRASIPRHRRYLAAMGVTDRFAGEIAIDMRVSELSDAARTYRAMVQVGVRLRDEHGTDVIVMGCAGMAAFRDRLEDELGIPVVDPTQAAVGMAVTRVLLAGASS